MPRRRLHWTAIALLLATQTACSGLLDHWTGEDVSREVRATGRPAEAVVLDIWETGVTVNDDPVIGFLLEVHAAGRPSWEAETRMMVSLLAIPRIQPGARLDVFYDPADPSRVAIATEADHPPAADGAIEPHSLGEDLRVEPLGDGVWRHVSETDLESFGRVPANGLVVLDGAEAALVDTPWTEEQTRRLIAWIAATQGARVSVVVSTHSHADCTGGLAAAHRAGARSFAHLRTAELARAAGAEVPQVRFTERLDVQLGSRQLTLHYLGPAHTTDNIVVWVPDAGVLFGGCALRSAAAKGLGYTEEADLERWPRTIEAMRREYGAARIFVPGHGEPGGSELLDRTLRLVEQHLDGAAGP